MNNNIKYVCCCAVLSVLLIVPGSVLALPVQVGTELVLLADVSGSLDSADFELQRDGYAAAFRDTDVIDSIVANGGIAAILVYWSTGQSVAVGWTHIYDAASADSFSSAIENASRSSRGYTNMADVMNFAVGLLTSDNGFESARQVVDVSGDGADTEWGYALADAPPVQDARNNLVNNAGVDMINALFIDDRDYFGDDPEDLVNAYYYANTNIIAGTGAFVDVVDSYADFPGAVRNKIITELHPVPEPTTILLLGTGLAGLAGFRRKFRK